MLRQRSVRLDLQPHELMSAAAAGSLLLRTISVIAAASHHSACTPANAVTGAGNVIVSINLIPKTEKLAARNNARYPNTRGSTCELSSTIPSGRNRLGAATTKYR